MNIFHRSHSLTRSPSTRCVTRRFAPALFALALTAPALIAPAELCAAAQPARGGLPGAAHFSASPEAFPLERLHTDWLLQDAGVKNAAKLFTAAADSTAEAALVAKVLAELPASTAAPFRAEATALTTASASGNDPRWKDLYLRACAVRRAARLAPVAAKAPRILYTKHCVLSGPCQFHPTDMVTDNPYKERLADFRPGAQLCLLTLDKNGTVRSDVVLHSEEGMIRDPALSFDGAKLAFSMRRNFTNDDYHLYTANLPAASAAASTTAAADPASFKLDPAALKQITTGAAISDVEPAFLPNGDIVFQSTRCIQLTDCWPVPASNLYMCAPDGTFLRRVGFDQVHTLYPQVLDNGTVLYTRWEYNDRNPVHQQPLFQMNPDGTAQTSYYGGNSFFPTSVIHARGVPGTSKAVAIASGHHTDQRGKLILIDRSRGVEGNSGVDFLAPRRPANVPFSDRHRSRLNDTFGQDGEQFQYPFALDEENYIVAYLPEGGPRARYRVPFGIYWIGADGRRELLAHDPAVSSGQPVVLAPRIAPKVKPSTVDYALSTGHYYVQDVYQGPGLAGVKRGVVKTLRVVALEYRAAHAFDGKNGGNAHERGGSGFSSRVTTPVAAGNGTWEVKHILGEVPVEADGSVYFEAPARTSLYFQLLDERGYVVQTMRSWTTLQPGETFGCVGCHEYNTAPAARAGVPIALRKAPRRLAPTAYTHGGISNADSYLGVNRPKGFDKPAGFSFPLQVQPVLDKHCVSCHDGAGTGKGDLVNGIKKAKLDLSARLGDVAGRQNEHPWRNNGRAYSTAYLNLTNYGMPGKFTDWVDAEGVPLPLPAYLNGSSKSKLMRFLEPTHNSVRLSTEEKRLVAAWIDLGVPFCGSYTEANLWDQNLKTRYTYFEGKRAKYAEVELASLRAYLNEKK